MKSVALVVFAVLAVANAGVYNHAVVADGVTLQGPSTRTAVVGPDGTSIVAAAPGGTVSTSVDVGYAAHTTGVIATAPAVVAARYAAPLVSAYSAPVVAAHAAPVVSTYAAHGVYTPGVVAGRSYIGAPVAYSGYAAYSEGSGLRGQYVHDYTENLYDDGSYKPEIYH